MEPLVEIECVCKLEDASSNGSYQLPNMSRPVLRSQGRHFVCVVKTQDERTVEPGETSKIEILAIDDGGLLQDLEGGSRSLELLTGSKLIGRCEVLAWKSSDTT